MDKVGRNDPCPCGSGQKYKKCCLGKDAATDASSDQGRFSEEVQELVAGRTFGSLKEAEAFLGWQIARKNRQGRVEFEGLSSEQMSKILYAPFDSPQLVAFPDMLEIEPDAPVMRLLDLLLDAIGPMGSSRRPRGICRVISAAPLPWRSMARKVIGRSRNSPGSIPNRIFPSFT